jgi:aryl sulfotransferase
VAGFWWLASYPKSGNTWLRVVIATLLSGRPADSNAIPLLNALASDRSQFDDVLGIESADLTVEQETNLRPRAYEIWAAEASQPIYCKTHDAYHRTSAGEPLFPTAVTPGAVYVVRDPRAVAVSLAHHTARTVDEAIAFMNNPAAAFSVPAGHLPRQLHQRLERWHDHVESWLAAPFPVHLVRYEDMHSDPHAVFAGIAAFLGLPFDPERIAAAIETAAFPRLQALEQAVGFSEKPIQAAAFFREGSVDGWRRTLLPEQAARIVDANEAVMLRLGYDTALTPLGEPSARKASSRP